MFPSSERFKNRRRSCLKINREVDSTLEMSFLKIFKVYIRYLKLLPKLPLDELIFILLLSIFNEHAARLPEALVKSLLKKNFETVKLSA